MRFGGSTYSPGRDGPRLSRQLDRVRSLMRDGKWRSLYEIGESVGAPAQSVSARLRDLRKERNGRLTVQRKSMGRGLWLYRVKRGGSAR